MSITRSKFKKRWVYIQFSDDGPWMKAYIKRMTRECGFEAYEVAWENGNTEFVFVNSVHRVVEENPKKARVIDFNKRRKKVIRLVK